MKTCRLGIIKLSLRSIAIGMAFAGAITHAGECERALAGARFLHQQFPALYKSTAVSHKTDRDPALTQPSQKINAWLSEFENLYRHARQDPRAARRLRSLAYRQFVTKASEVSPSFFELQERIRREHGLGDVELEPNERRRLAETAERDQINSLDQWLKYFASRETDHCPTWLKYWALVGLTKLSKYDPQKRSFRLRSRGQALPFPELNREAFAHLVFLITRRLQNNLTKDIDPDTASLLESPSFGRLYARTLNLVGGQARDLTITAGRWEKFARRSDAVRLADTLVGWNTGWCTAQSTTAALHLAGGDFYVYFSEDSGGHSRVPRLAIRMEGNHITEVRGIGPDQELDSDIARTNILGDKLKEFGEEGAAFLKKVSDMKQLTKIDRQVAAQTELNAADLRFLYEVDRPIVGFGYGRDPRLDRLRLGRLNQTRDLVLALGVDQSELSFNANEAFEPGIRYHLGDLVYPAEGGPGLTFPEHISGNLDIGFSELPVNLRLPRYVGNSLYFSYLMDGTKLILPEYVGDTILFGNLVSAPGMRLPKTVSGSLFLSALDSADDVEFSITIGGNLFLSSLVSTRNLKLPDEVDGSLNLSSLTSARGLILPRRLGTLEMENLISAEGLVLPKTMGSLTLPKLASSKDLMLPEVITGTLDLSGLTSTLNLQLPKRIGGVLKLKNFESLRGLRLPSDTGGGIYLVEPERGITPAELRSQSF